MNVVDKIASWITDDPDTINEGKGIKITGEMVKCARDIYDDLTSAVKIGLSTKYQYLGTYSVKNPYHQRIPNLDVALEYYRDLDSHRSDEYTIGNMLFGVFLTANHESAGVSRIENIFYGKILLNTELATARTVLHEIIHLIDPKVYPKLWASNYSQPGKSKRKRFEYLSSPIEIEAEMPIIARGIIAQAYEFGIDNGMNDPVNAVHELITSETDHHAFKYFAPSESLERLRVILSNGRHKRKFMNTLFHYYEKLKEDLNSGSHLDARARA